LLRPIQYLIYRIFVNNLILITIFLIYSRNGTTITILTVKSADVVSRLPCTKKETHFREENIMNKFLTNKVGIAFVLILSLAFTVLAQNKLRTAMNYDGDTKADFTIFRPSNNAWYISKSGGGVTITQFGINTDDFMTPGDFDGDGRGDIAVWRDTTGVWYWLRSIDNVFVANQFGLPGDEPVARDYDGDGKTDIAVVRRTNGAMIWYSLNSTTGFRATQFGLSTDFTYPGDFDGDGKFDLAVQRPGATATSQALFYILASTAGFSAQPWGLTNDAGVPGDYDGDGKTDLAIVRDGALATDNLVWAYIRSSDGAARFYSFGITGTDLTTQNDYDGDGKCDVSIWRDPTGDFYYLSSLTNSVSFSSFHWGLSGDFPVAGYDSH
jgi:spore coat protein A, manganese oxidase